MARKAKKSSTPKREEQRTVMCGSCRHFQQDTDGISRQLDTGVYFMGICELGLQPDSPIKQFATKWRTCKKYQGK